MQSVPITTTVVDAIPTQGSVNSRKYFTFVSDLRMVVGFHGILLFSSLLKLTSTIKIYNPYTAEGFLWFQQSINLLQQIMILKMLFITQA